MRAINRTQRGVFEHKLIALRRRYLRRLQEYYFSPECNVDDMRQVFLIICLLRTNPAKIDTHKFYPLLYATEKQIKLWVSEFM